ncbi:MAG: ABC transporter permease [Phycisphaerae bacterium]|nr:ABC transporter permease [Phycisphaerae bacterium]
MAEPRPHPGVALAAIARDLLWPLVALAAILVVGAIFAPGFLTIGTIDGRLVGTPIDILNHGSKVAIVALGMTLVIATGGVDLSVGAVVAIAAAVTATLVSEQGVPWPLAVPAAVLVGTMAGLWNGMLVTVLRLQPIVATLVLMVAGRGIAQLVTGGLIVTVREPAIDLIGNGASVGLPNTFWLLAAVFLGLALLVRRTALGLLIACVGDNDSASRLAGVPERSVRLFAYAVCGSCAAIAGLIDCSYIRAADVNNAGQLLELDAILAVVIGGTALTGGRFSLIGSIIGAMLMQSLTRLLYMLDVSAEIAPAPKAMVVLAVCLLQSSVFRAFVGRVARRQEAGTP